MEIPTTNTITHEEVLRLREIEKKYNQLRDEIGKFYEEESEGDLCDIGEAAAYHFGFL